MSATSPRTRSQSAASVDSDSGAERAASMDSVGSIGEDLDFDGDDSDADFSAVSTPLQCHSVRRCL